MGPRKQNQFIKRPLFSHMVPIFSLVKAAAVVVLRARKQEKQSKQKQNMENKANGKDIRRTLQRAYFIQTIEEAFSLDGGSRKWNLSFLRSARCQIYTSNVRTVTFILQNCLYDFVWLCVLTCISSNFQFFLLKLSAVCIFWIVLMCWY